MWAKRSSRSPKMGNCKQFAQVANQKWATVSKSLRLLTKNEQMSESLFFSELLICLFFAKNERFAQKTDERIPNPACHYSNYRIRQFELGVVTYLYIY